MSLKRPASGRRVGAGILRVDAARAIQKLRDYQLTNPILWILESIRAAVASGATRVDLQGDSNDIWLRWNGPAWQRAHLPELLSELVSPASAQHGQELRLLATGINSALGLDLAYIDLYRIENQRSEKVRYTPEVLEVEEEDGVSSALKRLTLEKTDMPSRAGDASMFLHLRRRLGVEPLRNLLRGEPPEFGVARDACRDLPVPITIGDQEFGAQCKQSDVLRVTLGENIDGYLALRDPRTTDETSFAEMHVAEHGVLIAKYPLQWVPAFPHAPLPVRLFVNAERMPTNASRSDVRRTAHPIKAAENQVFSLLEKLCEQLFGLLGPGANTNMPEQRREELRAGALALLASAVAGLGWNPRARNLRGPSGELAKLALLRNAGGTPRSLADIWDEDILHVGREPLPQEVRDSFRETLWVPPGDPAAALMPYDVDPAAIKLRLRTVRTQLRAKRRFERHAQRDACFERVPKHWVRAPLSAAVVGTCAPLPHPCDTRGEICLLRRGEGGSITVLVDGREIEQVEVASELPFQAIVSDRKLCPDPTYRSVIHDRHYDAMIKVVRGAAIRCVEAMCKLAPEPFVQREAASEEQLRVLTLDALRVAHGGLLGLTGINRDTPLAKVAVWPLLRGGWVSLHDLRALKVLATVPNAEGIVASPAHTTVICPDPVMRALLRIKLEPQTYVIHYGTKDLSTKPETARQLARSWVHMNASIVALAIEEEGLRGSVVWGLSKNFLSIRHCGKQLANHTLSGRISVIVDSDRVVPTQCWAEVRDGAGLEKRDYADWEVALARAFASALLGLVSNELAVSRRGLDMNQLAGQCFMKAVAECDDMEQFLGVKSLRDLRKAPLFAGRSASQLAQDFPSSIDYLTTAPLGLGSSDWHPLIATKTMAEFAARLADRGLVEASTQLAARFMTKRRRVNRQAHLQQVPISLYSLMQGSPVVIDFHGELAQGLVGIGTRRNQCQLFLLCDERRFLQSEQWSRLPLVAALEMDPSLADESFESISDATRAIITNEVAGCAQALIEFALQTDPHALANNAEVREFCILWLEQGEPDAGMQKWIVDTAIFSDQRGAPLALADSFRDGSPLRTSIYDGEWLEPEEGEVRTALDESVTMIPELAASEFRRLWKSIWGVQVSEDVSVDMRRLQMERRVRQGLVLAPTVPGGTHVKRRLRDLIASESLGEICFFNGPQTEVRLFQEGIERTSLRLETYPPVLVAVEVPELSTFSMAAASLLARVERLSHALLRDVLGTEADLPNWLRLQLIRSLLRGDISAPSVPGLTSRALLRTTTGNSVSWEDLVEQEKRFGDVWYARAGDTRQPLDPHRIVIALQSYEFEAVSPAQLQFVHAEEELDWDEQARINQAREPLHSLALSAEQESYAITSIELKADDGLRGVIAPLLPDQYEQRGVKAHRNMQSIGDGEDPCSWPTLAIIDDPTLSPNRTWSEPEEDAQWKQARKAIAKASEKALKAHVPLPKGSITSHWVGGYVESRRPSYSTRGIVFRGRLWLTNSTEPGFIEIQDAERSSRYHLRVRWCDRDVLLPVHGRLLCHGPPSAQLDLCLQELGNILYSELLLQVASRKSVAEDSRAAHLAMGLALGRIGPATVTLTAFPCFAPAALQADELHELMVGEGMVAMIEADVPNTASLARTLFINDESELSKTLMHLLGHRLYHHEILIPPSVEVSATIDLEVSEIEVPKESAHALVGLAYDLSRRLVVLDLNAGNIVVHIEPDRESPLLSSEIDFLVLAGDNEYLRAIEVERMAGSIYYEGALDLLVMHALAVLNEGWMLITDAGERRGLLSLLRQK